MSTSFSSSDSPLVGQLRQSLGMLQVAFDAAAEAMVIIDAQRRIHWANQASASSLVEGLPIQVVNRDLGDLIRRLVPDESKQDPPPLMDP